MTKPFGATPEVWDHFSFALGLTEDLLPVVADRGVAIAAGSTLKATGKVPSIISRGGAVGIGGWTQKHTAQDEIERWRADGRLGICIQTRTVRAIDVDIEDPETARQVYEALYQLLPVELPKRYRENSSKFLLAFNMPGEFPKRVIRLGEGRGLIELLGTGQQFIAYSTHPSGARYEWEGGLPDDIPTLTLDQVEALWAALADNFGTSVQSTAPTKAKTLAEAASKDEVAVYLHENGYVLSNGKDGSLNITCPFEDGHSSASSDTSTTYFPAHTGGYALGHFKCLHASCEHREDDDFKAKLGIRVPDPFEGFTPIVDDILDSRTANTDDADTSTSGFTNLDVDGAPAKKVEAPRFTVVPAHEFAAKPAPGWIVKGVLPKAGLAVIYGDSGSGKTFLAMDICGAIARGEDWRGHKVAQGKVTYVCAEGVGGMRSRLKAYSQHHGVNLADLPFGVIPDAPNFMQVQDVKDTIVALQTFAAGERLAVVVVDTFAQVMSGGNENAGEDVGKALEHCRQIHKYTGALVVLIHHSGKDSSKGARGWSGLRAAADAEIEVVRDGENRQAEVTKMKDGKEGEKFGFKLESVKIGEDEDKEPITSCVVVEAAVQERVKASKGAAASINSLAEEVVGTALAHEQRAAYTDVIAEMVRHLPPPMPGKKDTRSSRAAEGVMRLLDAGKIVLVDGFVTYPSVGTEGFGVLEDTS